MFTISVTKITEVAAYHKPVIVKAKGTIEHYPEYDDEWEDK